MAPWQIGLPQSRNDAFSSIMLIAVWLLRFAAYIADMTMALQALSSDVRYVMLEVCVVQR